MPVILICIILFVLWLSYERKKVDKSSKKKSEEFWKREHESNLIRRKDLSNLDYITINYENLPFFENVDSEIQYVQDQLIKLKDEKIVNLSGLSNTDLKLTYGSANINELSLYDQNYTLLVRNLNKWAQLLYAQNKIAETKQVLEYAISIGSDISQSFLTLATIYLDEGDLERLHSLKEKAEQISSPLKMSLVEKLTAINEKASHAQK